MRKTFKYKLQPTPEQEATLAFVLRRCCELYYAALEERREAWRMCAVSITVAGQSAQLPEIKQARPEYQDIYHPGARGPLPAGRGMNGPLPEGSHCVLLERFVRALNPCGVACGPAPAGAPCQAMVRGVPLGKPPAGKISAVPSSPK
jgi:hypothetical protein